MDAHRIIHFGPELSTAAAAFLGSFLLFLVQPMTARAMLPSFGGSAAVWTTCLAAYETLLVFGYWRGATLANVGTRRLGEALRRRRVRHTAAVALGGAWIALCAWRLLEKMGDTLGLLSGGAAARMAALAAVSLAVGAPYVLLAANSTLVQAIYAERRGAAAYRLYGLSNLGSVFGLATYPLVLERLASLEIQFAVVGAGMVALAVLLAAALARASTAEKRDGGECRAAESGDGGESAGPTVEPSGKCRKTEWWRLALWTVIPGVSCAFMTATTTLVCSDISPLPLLWTLFLGIFLLSYVAGFTVTAQKCLPILAVTAAAALLPLSSFVADASNLDTMTPVLLLKVRSVGIPTYAVVLLFLHTWLYALRPEGKRRMGAYYLCGAAGGAAGGLLSGVAAPVVFDWLAEYPICLAATATLVSAWATGNAAMKFRSPDGLHLRGLISPFAALAASALAMLSLNSDLKTKTTAGSVAYRGRDFYGEVTVLAGRHSGRCGTATELFHGRTRHGMQPETPAEESLAPTTYYGANGGGMAVEAWRRRNPGKPLRMGIVGLGVGTMATWAEPGDEVTFFEISPEVIRVATNPSLFTYLSKCKGSVHVVEGDGRRLLAEEERTSAPKWDILEIDAFSGDSIPMQLVSDEAFDLYRRRLAPGGLLGLHVSNWQFDLLPLLKRQRDRLDMDCEVTTGAEDPAMLLDETVWAWYAEKVAADGSEGADNEINANPEDCVMSGRDALEAAFDALIGSDGGPLGIGGTIIVGDAANENIRKQQQGGNARRIRIGGLVLELPVGGNQENLDLVSEKQPISDHAGSLLPYLSKRVKTAFFNFE